MTKDDRRPAFAAWRAAHLVDRLARLQRAAAFEGGLNPAQWEALRYLARANRFSKTPAALAEFLSSSRGTVSQTLIALEGKGLIEKTRSESDGRSQSLALTLAGRRALEADPEAALARDIEGSGKAPAVAAALEDALRLAIARRGGKAFGVCKTCKFFERAGASRRCALLKEDLSAQDAEAICAEMVAA
jgi:DNA-binding MarR family transcriptional regulator